MTRFEEQGDNTGERGAVGPNSGLPVDDSGPGLRRPTTPLTPGRKPEARPPDYFDTHSQHKSRWGSGASTAREAGFAREARGLDSSFLDEIQNNRNKDFTEEFKALKRNRNCGRFTVVGTSTDGRTHKLARVNCKTWGCCYCGPKKARRYKFLIGQLAEHEQLTRFLTLTLDPKLIEGDSVRYLRKVFDKFRLYLRRRFGASIKYIAVLEFHKSGVAHLHLLVDRYIPWEWIKESWSALGGGHVVFIKYVDVHRISRYLSKYLTKELLLSAPMRSRRVTTARSLHLIPKPLIKIAWKFWRLSIFFFFSRLYRWALNIEVDEDKQLQSFTTTEFENAFLLADESAR